MPRGAILEGVGLGEALKFDSVERAAQMNQQNKQLAFQYKKQEQREKEQQQKQAESGAKWFNTYANSKFKFTGNMFDPIKHQKMDQAVAMANEMFQSGQSVPTVMMAVGGLIEDAAKYDVAAKQLDVATKAIVDDLSKKKGYNVSLIKQKLNETLDKVGVDNIDPNNIGEYLSTTFKDHGMELTNDDAIKDWAAKLPTKTIDEENSTTNWNGTKKKSRLKGVAPTIFERELNDKGEPTNNFVPKYEHVMDGDNLITYPFDDGKGGTIEKPIRIVTKDVLVEAMGDKAIADRIDALTNDALKKGLHKDEEGNPITADSTDSELVKRAILYDELKNKAKTDIRTVKEDNFFDKYSFEDHKNKLAKERIRLKANLEPVNDSDYDANLINYYYDNGDVKREVDPKTKQPIEYIYTTDVSSGHGNMLRKQGLEPTMINGKEAWQFIGRNKMMGEGGQVLFGNDIKFATDKREGKKWYRAPIVPKTGIGKTKRNSGKKVTGKTGKSIVIPD